MPRAPKDPETPTSLTVTPAVKPRTRKRAPASPFPAQVALAVTAAADKQALDVVVLDLRKAKAFTDFFIICTGTSQRQVNAIADSVQDALGKKRVKPTIVEGESRGEWVLLDYFDFVVHVFTPTTREFYGLERLWADAERVEVPA